MPRSLTVITPELVLPNLRGWYDGDPRSLLRKAQGDAHYIDGGMFPGADLFIVDCVGFDEQLDHTLSMRRLLRRISTPVIRRATYLEALEPAPASIATYEPRDNLYTTCDLSAADFTLPGVDRKVDANYHVVYLRYYRQP